jgi:8-oxo-dGTP pyrophosphatase MutT (NUDIX family)
VAKKIRSSGALILSQNTKRILLLQKSAGKNAGIWGLVGGKVEAGESFWQGLMREITEEIGVVPNFIKSIPLESYVSDDTNFNFQTFVCIVKDEFIPILSKEHKAWGWCDISDLPKPTHQGIKNTISDKIVSAKLETVFAVIDNLS